MARVVVSLACKSLVGRGRVHISQDWTFACCFRSNTKASQNIPTLCLLHRTWSFSGADNNAILGSLWKVGTHLDTQLSAVTFAAQDACV